MKKTGIWIDTSKAIVVDIENGSEKVTEIQSDVVTRQVDREDLEPTDVEKGSFMGHQHISNENRFEEKKKHQLSDFIEEVMEHLKTSKEAYLFGPAELKNKLAKAIKENTLLRKLKLIGVETADSMTDNQVVAKVKEAFKD